MKPEGKMKEFNTSTTATTDNNVMPSMVVRQQRIQMGTSANQQQGQSNTRRPNVVVGGQQQATMVLNDEPSPTCSLIKAAKEMNGSKFATSQQQEFDQDGLVLPKRVLYHHPVPMAQPIIRDLNRELKFNQIRGKNVLDQKSELKKALEKLEDAKRKREAEQERLSRRSSLELRLEERAERIAKTQSSETSSTSTSHHHHRASTAPSSTSAAGPQAATATAQAPCKTLSNFSIRSITR